MTDNAFDFADIDSARAFFDLRFLMENLRDAVFLKSPDLVYIACNERYAADRNRRPEEIRGLTDFELHPVELATKYRADDRRVLAEASYHIIDELDLSDGVTTPVQTTKTALRDAGGRIIGLLGTYRQPSTTTNEPRMRRALKALEHLPQGFVFTDDRFRTVDANPAYSRLIDHNKTPPGENKPPFFVDDGRHFSESAEIKDALDEQGQWQGEVWKQNSDGDFHSLWASISHMHPDADADFQYLAWFTDIQNGTQERSSLHHLAYHDTLTGLPNRLLFLDRLEQALRRAQRNRNRVAVLFIDTDNFKPVNDSYGHAVGDQVISEIGKRLGACLRDGDTVARFGGDEFTLVLEEIQQPEDALMVAEKLRECLSPDMHIEGHTLSVTASIGVALYPEHGDHHDALIRHADQAMYQAKRNGGNQCSLFPG